MPSWHRNLCDGCQSLKEAKLRSLSEVETIHHLPRTGPSQCAEGLSSCTHGKTKTFIKLNIVRKINYFYVLNDRLEFHFVTPAFR